MDTLSERINSLTINSISQVEKELDIYDVSSLVFLLYDAVDIAKERLILLQTLNKNVPSNNIKLNPLYDWAISSFSLPGWQYKFLEALTICQLYNIIRKLGFHVQQIKDHFLPNNFNLSININICKKALYKVAENMSEKNFQILKSRLHIYDIKEYESCELVFLELIRMGFIRIYDNISLENLIYLLKELPSMEDFGDKLRTLQNTINKNCIETRTVCHVIEKNQLNTEKTMPKSELNDNNITSCSELATIETLNILNKNTNKLHLDSYHIKNSKRLGVCYIINQENFYSTPGSDDNFPLKNRKGSSQDKILLETTMSQLNFCVITHNDLNDEQMKTEIKNVIDNEVQHSDSLFMMCILSHGVREHIFACNSVKVKVEDIQELLDTHSSKLRGLPKIIVIQACQTDDANNISELVADGPCTNSRLSSYCNQKTDFLIFWATVAKYNAYRDTEKGSIFIQCLCRIIQLNKHRDLYEIFTIVNKCVVDYCNKTKCTQVPKFEVTLTKKLYFYPPSLDS